MTAGLSAIPLQLQGEVLQTRGSDGTPLLFRRWLAPGPSDAVVYLHGIAGHSLWFSSAASRLATEAFTVYGFDRRGSGLNKQDRGHLPSYKLLLDDIYDFVSAVRAEHAGRKVFLVAGCWGAKAGVLFAQRHGQLLDGLALISPALVVRIKLPFVDMVGVAKNLPSNPRKYFEIPLKPEQYTGNPGFRAFVAEDPDRLLEATARFFFETARMDKLVHKVASGIHVPVLVLQAGRDEIVDVDGLRDWFGKVASRDKTFKVYPDFAHILEFEERRDEYVADLLAWLKAHGTRSAATNGHAGTAVPAPQKPCGRCGAPYRAGARFCGRCGEALPAPAGEQRIRVRFKVGATESWAWLVLENCELSRRGALDGQPELRLSGVELEALGPHEPELRLRRARLRV